MTRHRSLSLSLFAAIVCLMTMATSVFAQGNPTGGLSGQVSDSQGLALPGVTVTVSDGYLLGEACT